MHMHRLMAKKLLSFVIVTTLAVNMNPVVAMTEADSAPSEVIEYTVIDETRVTETDIRTFSETADTSDLHTETSEIFIEPTTVVDTSLANDPEPSLSETVPDNLVTSMTTSVENESNFDSDVEAKTSTEVKILETIETAASVTPRAATTDFIPVNETTFPDYVFRHFVIDNICAGSPELTPEIIAKTTNMLIDKLNVETFKGIEFFSALKNFTCVGDRALKYIDLRQNSELVHVTISYNRGGTKGEYNNAAPVEIYLSGLSKLEYLYCYGNKLTELDLSGLYSLKILDCYNNQLSSLNITHLLNLEKLNCSSNKFSSININALARVILLIHI